MLPYYDQRLPLRPDQPELEFALQQYEITSDEEWQQVCHSSYRFGAPGSCMQAI
jgi:hypothetical protein